MINLIRGDIRRMAKGKPFIICLFAVFCLSAWDVFDTMLQRAVNEQLEETRPVDLFYYSFSNLMMVSIVVGLCTVFLIVRDFDGGNIKNKILAGYSKLKIYISGQIVSFLFGLILMGPAVATERFFRTLNREETEPAGVYEPVDVSEEPASASDGAI